MIIKNPTLETKSIKEQLGKIFRVKQFKNSRILTDFLTFIVDESLKGNEKILKEYVIATEVLKKNTNFNPQLDAIVRVHAGRLRNLLENYYLEEGKNDPIVISIPKGSYIPEFSLRNSIRESSDNFKSKGEKETKPSVAIFPVKHFNNNERLNIICSAICQELSIELSKFQEIKVISNYFSNKDDFNTDSKNVFAKKFGVEYLILGSFFQDGKNMDISVELHSVCKDELVWAESFILEDFETSNIRSYRTIINKVITVTCGFLGIIFRDKLYNYIPKDYNYLYAIYWHNRYHQNFSEETYKEASQAIEIGLKHNPNNSLLYSLKAQMLLDLKTLDVQLPFDITYEGMRIVTKAISLDGSNQHAWLILMWAYLLEYDKRSAIRSIEKCLSINPNNDLYKCAGGFMYICMGEYQKGYELMEESVKTNPFYFWVVNVALCYYYLRKKEFEEALFWAKIIKRNFLLWDPLLRLTCLGWLGRMEEAKIVAKELMNLSPNFKERGIIIIDTFLYDEKLKTIILEGLELAGIIVDKEKTFTNII